ncbi:MAG: hypothetical protein HY881_07945 [Deltaproteobacteria bacterium]|nr:hypothetical protein [Deltaproteobacteria bacterium]
MTASNVRYSFGSVPSRRLGKSLGKAIMFLKALDVPVGVITNSSLLWRDDVRDELAKADWVSLKIDAVQEDVWRQINRPHKAISLSRILDGMLFICQSLFRQAGYGNNAYPGA